MRWSTRLSVVTLGTLVLPAIASLVTPGAPTPEQGAGTDVTALALTAQATLLGHAGQYRQLEQELAERTAALETARDAERAALAQAGAQQDVVGASASTLYRSAPSSRLPVLQLSVQQPAATSDILFRQSLTERSDEALQGTVVRAERTAAAAELATRRVADAQSAVDAVSRRAGAVLAAARADAADLRMDVTARLAALGTIPAAGAQQDRNQEALRRWQDYLARLAAAGITAPPAADLADAEHLPPGLSPALDAGAPVPGVAWAIIGNQPVTVLPAETVVAVSGALSQLGKPFVPGATGPDTYDCGGFASASWLLAGYAVPTTPQDQWSTGATVPVDALQVGDLVFSPGGRDVGLYLGDGQVLGASAATYQVGVRPMPTGATGVRVPVPSPTDRNAPLPGGGGEGACGAPLPVPGTVSPAWGGYANGQIPSAALCPLGVAGHVLRCDAAASYGQLSAAYAAAFGDPLCITDSYRPLSSQVATFYRKPALAAVPGTSNHGWALAVDLCGGIHVAGTAQWTWMTHHAGAFGFVQPDWAQPGGERPEPWHWEYGHIS